MDRRSGNSGGTSATDCAGDLRARLAVVAALSCAPDGFRRIDGNAWAARPRAATPAEPRSSPAGLLSHGLLDTYRRVNPEAQWREQRKAPPRVLSDESGPLHNSGRDNRDYDLVLRVGDVLSGPHGNTSLSWCQGTSYTVIDLLGKGTFGQVVKCRDEARRRPVAVKVLKSKPVYYRQGLLEVGVLTAVNTDCDRTGERHTYRLLDHFMHHGHLCLVFELLSMDLYSLLKHNSFKGLSFRLIRKFVGQILSALEGLAESNIVHCDLKPENILLENLKDANIKVIDFGSACFESSSMYTYIQSRHYRAPEVILGLPYSCAIDVWSLGCIAAELFLGIPLFPGSSSFNQITRITEMVGPPPASMVERGTNGLKYFRTTIAGGYVLKTPAEYEADTGADAGINKRYYNHRNLFELCYNHKAKSGVPGLSPEDEASEVLECRRAFEHFLVGVLNVDPEKRWTASQALAHPFVQGQPLVHGYVVPPPRRRYTTPPRPKTEYPSSMQTILDFGPCYTRFTDGLRAGRIIDATVGTGKVLAPLMHDLIPAQEVLIGMPSGKRLWGTGPKASGALAQPAQQSQQQQPMPFFLPQIKSPENNRSSEHRRSLSSTSAPAPPQDAHLQRSAAIAIPQLDPKRKKEADHTHAAPATEEGENTAGGSNSQGKLRLFSLSTSADRCPGALPLYPMQAQQTPPQAQHSSSSAARGSLLSVCLQAQHTGQQLQGEAAGSPSVSAASLGRTGQTPLDYTSTTGI